VVFPSVAASATQKFSVFTPRNFSTRSKAARSATQGAPWTLYLLPPVLFIRMAMNALDGMLARENRTELAQACFDFLPTNTML